MKIKMAQTNTFLVQFSREELRSVLDGLDFLRYSLLPHTANGAATIVNALAADPGREDAASILRPIADALYRALWTKCDGCDERGLALGEYAVMHHDGSSSRARYCDTCAELAACDWTGTTARIERVRLDEEGAR